MNAFKKMFIFLSITSLISGIGCYYYATHPYTIIVGTFALVTSIGSTLCIGLTGDI